jgi:lipid-binding SYLF domain-containing protein
MKILLSLLFSSFVLSAVAQARSIEELRSTALDASQVVQSLSTFGDRTIPTGLLKNAQCIATLPGVIRAGVLIGGEYGRGLVSCRISQGGWSSPVLLSITGGSFGLQLGAQSTDIVLLFMRPSALDKFSSGEFRLGADATLTAGPIGRQAKAGVDYKDGSDIYSYSRSSGLFGGLTIDSMHLRANHDDDTLIYGSDMQERYLLSTRTAGIPQALATYVDTLTAIAP